MSNWIAKLGSAGLSRHIILVLMLAAAALPALAQDGSCRNPDPTSFDQVLACMSSLRYEKGMAKGQNVFENNIGTRPCMSIAGTYLQGVQGPGPMRGDETSRLLPSCAIFAQAVEAFTGKPADWSACTNYPGKFDAGHMRACLTQFVPSYYGGKRAPGAVGGCQGILDDYERALLRASVSIEGRYMRNTLPPGYVRPSCEAVADIFATTARPSPPSLAQSSPLRPHLIQTETTSAWKQCLGYTPDAVAAHIAQCLGEASGRENSCINLRRLYETKLREAYGGGLPPGYVLAPCASLMATLEAKQRRLAEAREQAQKLAAEQAEARRRAQEDSMRQTPIASSAPAVPETPVIEGEPVAACDGLAAHPDDPEAVRPGVTDEALVARSVLIACEAAVRDAKETPRLRFQLARGYLKADRTEDAVEQLVSAAEQGHGGALAYLGDLFLHGAPGIEADPSVAHGLYQNALASGFAPAEALLEQYEDWTAELAKAEAEEQEELAREQAAAAAGIPYAKYRNPDIIQSIFVRRFDAIPYGEAWVKEYLYNIADNIRAICEGGFTQSEVNALEKAAKADVFNLHQSALAAGALGNLTALATMLKNPVDFAQREEVAHAEDAFEQSLNDTAALLQRHGCNTKDIERFAVNLKAYVHNEDAPIPPPDGIFNACINDPPPSKYKRNEFCLCFSGALYSASVPQGHRKRLLTDFKEAAIAIMDGETNKHRFQACRYGV